LKRIKSFKSFELSEKLGVFEGNIEFAELIYDRLLEEFKKEYGSKLDSYADIEYGKAGILMFPVTDIYNNLLRQKVEKNKTKVDLKEDIVFLLILDKSKDSSKPDYLKLGGASFSFDPYLDKNETGLSYGALIKYTIRRNSTNEELVYPNRYVDILDYLIKEKFDIIKTLSHESKHLIDSILGTMSKYDKEEYRIVTTVMKEYISELLGSPTPETKLFAGFLHDNYFLTRSENLVKPTEIAALMKLKGVKKEEFVSFLDQNPGVKKLREMSKRSYSELRNLDPKKLQNFLNKLGVKTQNFLRHTAFDRGEGGSNMPPEDYYKTDLFQKDLEDTIQDVREKSNVILKNTLENLEGASDEEIKKKSEKLFSDAENKVRGESEKMLRKIYKLYDLAG
jgi:hypothetical protein